MYSQLPDCGDFKGFDLPGDTEIAAISKSIYVNFYKPSSGPSKHHIATGGIHKESRRGIRENAQNDKRGEFKRERTFGRVGEIQIGNAFNELSEMDFVETWDQVTTSITKIPPRLSVGVFNESHPVVCAESQNREWARTSPAYHLRYLNIWRYRNFFVYPLLRYQLNGRYKFG